MEQFGKLHEECGVFGIYSERDDQNVAGTAYLALYALQHRGQMSCGIAVGDHGLIKSHKDNGLVPEVFSPETLESLGDGHLAIGHVRYGTSENADRASAQPMVVRHVRGNIALCFNGQLTNAGELRRELEMSGAIFQSNNDCEVIAYIFTRERLKAASTEEALAATMKHLKGAYSIVMMSARKLLAARDPQGFRPLCVGKREGQILFASESCALNAVGAELVRDVAPGEIAVASENGFSFIPALCGQKTGLCVFEFVYFARPDSVIDGAGVHEARQRAGAFLALEHPVSADVVVGAPDSGLDAAMGYARQSGIPYQMGFIKNRYVGRTFIEPTQQMREDAVRIKLSAIKSVVEGKRVILVDDSIVRGTTCERTVRILRQAGAKEVHLRISSPMFVHPCYFGTDVPSEDKLVACRLNHDVQAMAKEFNVDSLGFLDVDDTRKIAVGCGCEFCVGCFTGEYPVEPPKPQARDKYLDKYEE